MLESRRKPGRLICITNLRATLDWVGLKPHYMCLWLSASVATRRARMGQVADQRADSIAFDLETGR